MGTCAAFFDLDNTVLKINSGISYMRFLRRRGAVSRWQMARVIWWGMQYRIALLDVEGLARRLAVDYAGDVEDDVVAVCRVWYQGFVAPAITADARRAIERHRASGHDLVLLTGATQYVAEVVAEALRIQHTLCTVVQVEDGKLTGQLEQICFGRHKVRIAEHFAAERGIDLNDSVFYSDSYNDLPMLSRVGKPIAVNPDARLHRYARRAGWRVERWS